MPRTGMLTIVIDGDITDTADALFAGTADAVSQQGLIRMWATAGGEQEKHILYALAQRALLEFEDGELDMIQYPPGTILIADYDDLKVSFPEGAVLFVAEGHRTGLHIHEGINVVAMLRAFHRYATRMIRLDVR